MDTDNDIQLHSCDGKCLVAPKALLLNSTVFQGALGYGVPPRVFMVRSQLVVYLHQIVLERKIASLVCVETPCLLLISTCKYRVNVTVLCRWMKHPVLGLA